MNKELIETISRVLRTTKADGNLVGLFDKWNDPESTVDEAVMIDQLNSFERNFEESPTDTTDYIRIKDFTIQVKFLASIEPVDDYDGGSLINFQWFSSIDGNLGEGLDISKRLSNGSHEILSLIHI